MHLPLAASATTPPAGHCQFHHWRTEAGRPRNASASLTLYRTRPASVPKLAPFGGYTDAVKLHSPFPASCSARRLSSTTGPQWCGPKLNKGDLHD